MSEDQIDNMCKKGWGKEIACCEGVRPENQVDFSPIFDIDKVNEPLAPCLPPNRFMNLYFHNKLLEWRRKVCKGIHYPRSSLKNMAWSVREHYEELTGSRHEGIFHQAHYLQFERLYRISLPGSVEMRQKWYPSGFKPRTYYAQGGLYGLTYNLQGLFTDLVNITPITHHVSRLRPARLYALPGQYFRVYDLTSFTSMMWCQWDFLDHLARFCSGWPITIMSAKHGLIVKDLGEVLSDYNNQCNRNAEVTFRRCPFITINFTSRHNIAGMLGVYGNLMTCTFAHGVIMAQFCRDEDQINVAGDDGIVPETEETSASVEEAISLFGIHEESKEFITTEEGAIHLKRPIRQLENTLYPGSMIIWPNISNLNYWLYNRKDKRFSYYSDLKQEERISAIGRELFRFLRSIHVSGVVKDDIDFVACVNYCHSIARLVKREFWLPNDVSPSLTQCGDDFFWPYIPRRIEEINEHPWDLLCNFRYTNYVSLKVQADQPWDEQMEYITSGTVITCNSHRHLEFLVKLGLAERSSVTRVYSGEEGIERLLRSYFDTSGSLYVYKFLEEVDSRYTDF